VKCPNFLWISFQRNTLDLADDVPPHISAAYVEAMYVPIEQHTTEMTKDLALSNRLVDQLLAADLVVLATPMYNFGIPSILKSYIDHIVRSGRTFTADQTGFHGQVQNTQVVVVNSRGGAYKEEASTQMDFVQPYLRGIFGFIGITKINFINVEPTAFYGEEAKQAALEQAKKDIEQVITSFDDLWIA